MTSWPVKMTSPRKILEKILAELRVVGFIAMHPHQLFADVYSEFLLPNQLEISLLIFSTFIVVNIVVLNLRNVMLNTVLKILIIGILFLKLIGFIVDDIIFHEFFNSMFAFGSWEFYASILFLIILLMLLGGLSLKNNPSTTLFLTIFLYATSCIYFVNDFIILFLIFEIQLFTIFGILLSTSSKSKLNILFVYLTINILGTLLFLFGIVALYNKTGSLNFNNCIVEITGLSAFLPAGLVLKLIGTTTAILFQKLYGKFFIQLYGLSLILGEYASIMISIKIFSSYLILKSFPIYVFWITLFVVTLLLVTVAALRSKSVSSTLIYSATQSTVILTSATLELQHVALRAPAPAVTPFHFEYWVNYFSTFKPVPTSCKPSDAIIYDFIFKGIFLCLAFAGALLIGRNLWLQYKVETAVEPVADFFIKMCSQQPECNSFVKSYNNLCTHTTSQKVLEFFGDYNNKQHLCKDQINTIRPYINKDIGRNLPEVFPSTQHVLFTLDVLAIFLFLLIFLFILYDLYCYRRSHKKFIIESKKKIN